jgi:hypothetical protein
MFVTPAAAARRRASASMFADKSTHIVTRPDEIRVQEAAPEARRGGVVLVGKGDPLVAFLAVPRFGHLDVRDRFAHQALQSPSTSSTVGTASALSVT